MINLHKRLTINQISEIKKLAKAGISIIGISNVLHISKTTVYYHAKNYCRKMTKFDLTLLNECEKGYIIGLFLGDGSLNRGTKTPRYVARFALDAKRDQDIAASLAQILDNAHKKVSIFVEGNTLIVKACSKELVEFIETYVEYKMDETNQKEKKLLVGGDWASDFQYGVLAGIIDSDGHVHKHLGTEIKTVSPSTFQAILKLLNNLEIVSKTKRRKATENSYSKKDRYTIYLPSRQVKTRRNKIPSVKIKRFA